MRSNSLGEYNLSNPSYKPDNFLFKWNTNPKLETEFTRWIDKARYDIITNPMNFLEDDPIKLRDSLFESFGAKSTERAIKKYGALFGLANETGELYTNPKTMSTTYSGDISKIIPKNNTFFGN